MIKVKKTEIDKRIIFMLEYFNLTNYIIIDNDFNFIYSTYPEHNILFDKKFITIMRYDLDIKLDLTLKNDIVSKKLSIEIEILNHKEERKDEKIYFKNTWDK